MATCPLPGPGDKGVLKPSPSLPSVGLRTRSRGARLRKPLFVPLVLPDTGATGIRLARPLRSRKYKSLRASVVAECGSSIARGRTPKESGSDLCAGAVGKRPKSTSMSCRSRLPGRGAGVGARKLPLTFSRSDPARGDPAPRTSGTPVGEQAEVEGQPSRAPPRLRVIILPHSGRPLQPAKGCGRTFPRSVWDRWNSRFLFSVQRWLHVYSSRLQFRILLEMGR